MLVADFPWSSERLADRFADIDRSLSRLDSDIARLEPLAPEVSSLAASAAALARDVGKVELAVAQYVNRSVTKQLVIVSTPMFMGCAGLLFALLSGKIG